MGDMARCPKCATFHYRNDPCPDELIRRDQPCHTTTPQSPQKDMLMTATPRPWKLATSDPTQVRSDDDQFIADCSLSWAVRKGQGPPNAALIVTAVNNYEALADACKALVDYATEACKHVSQRPDDFTLNMMLADAVVLAQNAFSGITPNSG